MRVKYICSLFLENKYGKNFLDEETYQLLNNECIFFDIKFYKPHKLFKECMNVLEFPISHTKSLTNIINSNDEEGYYYNKYIKYKNKYFSMKKSLQK